MRPLCMLVGIFFTLIVMITFQAKENSMTKDGEVVNNPIIDSDKILTFPCTIPGFEKYTTHIVYHKEENDLIAV